MKRIGMLLVAVALAAGPASFAAADPALRVHLPREAAAGGQALALADVAVIRAADADLVRRAEAVALGRAPWPGEQLVIDRPTVMGRLAASGIAAADVQWTGAEQVVVSRREAAVEAATIVRAAEARLAAERPAPAGARWVLQRTPPAALVPAGDLRLGAGIAPHDVTGEAKVEVVTAVDGREAARAALVFRLQYDKQEAVATADIPAGALLTPQNVTLRTAGADAPQPADWVPPYGQRAVRAIRAGAVVLPSMGRAPQDPKVVRRGESVTMRIDAVGFSVLALGEALEDGRPGDCIRVRNVDSKRIVAARVAADGAVEPIFEGTKP
jgi:flagella basal body P-ring formation protein FlgA